VSLPGPAAFVPQDDRLHGFFTSKSYLEHYSRLAGKTPNPQEIDNLLQDMGLTDQANTIVGDLFLKGLSGGQKRRLSIALEALTGPKNFFLDEPTSGLDAESALQVMEFLKDYARAAPGRRVRLGTILCLLFAHRVKLITLASVGDFDHSPAVVLYLEFG